MVLYKAQFWSTLCCIFILLLQHPDNQMIENIVEVIKRFLIKMDHTEPIIGFADKGIALQVPKGRFGAIECAEEDANI